MGKQTDNVFALGLFLMIICLVSAAALTFTFQLTDPIIEQRRAEALAVALSQVLPMADHFEDITDEIEDLDQYGVEAVAEGRAGDQVVGYVFTVAPTGYAGPIRMVIGVTAEEIVDLQVLTQTETPGLGTRILQDSFIGQFVGRPVDSQVAGGSAGGDIDEITGATVSSAAVIRGVENARRLFEVIGDPDADERLAAELAAAMQNLLPEADSFEDITDTLDMSDAGRVRSVHIAYSGNDEVAMVFVANPEGYVAPIQMLVAISGDEIAAVAVLEHSESPGIGTRIEEDSFQQQFIGLSVDSLVALGRDGGSIDGLSGATVSSQAFSQGVEHARQLYEQIRRDR